MKAYPKNVLSIYYCYNFDRLNKYSDQKDSVEVLLKAERQKSVQQL